MKTNKLLLFFLLLSCSLKAQVGTNLLPVEDWNEGSGTVTVFEKNGMEIENVRSIGLDPHNESSIIWSGIASGNSGADGGWNADFAVDHTKTYRFAVWLKRNDSNEGVGYFGAGQGTSTLNLDGTPINNPYFWGGDLPELNKWYLLIGYVHGSNHTGTINYGGIYDGTTGVKVKKIKDYKNSPTATTQRHRIYFHYCTVAGESQDFWGARAEAVDGNEPTIGALLNGKTRAFQEQGNLVHNNLWEIGTGSLSQFTQLGNDLENVRVQGKNPKGETSIIWQSIPDGSKTVDGGWSAEFPVDKQKSYRFTTWVKRNNSQDGRTYFGAGAYPGTLNLNDNSVNNLPYFWNGDLPEVDKWYLLVGYVHGEDYTSTESIGGIYDAETGIKVLNCKDFKNGPTTTFLQHRVFFYDANQGDATQDNWGPRAETIDGDEPSIQNLLGLAPPEDNLIYPENWEVGIGSNGGFIKRGLDSENIREWGINPHGEMAILWKGESSGDLGDDGGWIASFDVDHTKTYRVSAWINRSSSPVGNSAFGASTAAGATLNLNGSPNSNPYFWSGDVPEANKWYLAVAYIHRSDYNESISYGGLYDGDTGEKVINFKDFKNSTTATYQYQRLKFSGGNAVGESQLQWGPRAEVMDGSEPSIQAILGLNPSDFQRMTGNLLPVEDWDIGQGNISEFTANGPEEANVRSLETNPFGEPSIIWTGTNHSTDADGGFEAIFPIDHTKPYRVSVWIKKSDSDDGTTLFGAANYTNSTVDLDGNDVNNPYFWGGDLPELEKWYLLVGYIHGSGYTGTTSLGGIYDGETGEKVLEMTDFKNSTTATFQKNRAYLYYGSTPNVKQEFWGPRAELIDGNEPSITTLLGLGSAIWSEITDGTVFNNGSVGIGVDENDMDPSYKLLVDGDIKTKKVKVTLDGWADYVFDESYELPPLATVEKYINEFGHLPDVPSEEVVLRDGIYLGETNALLLKKIEELTLYIIQMEKEIQFLKEEKENSKK